MKKLLVILSCSCIIISCGGGNDAKEEKKEQVQESKEEAPVEDPAIAQGLDLVAKSDCFTCHAVSEKKTGPAYQDVAQRYPATPEVIDTLAGKIISGGSGRWGSIPMTPHPQLSKEDATTMVKYVLSLKNNQ
jgi:cytochrome c